MEIVTTRFGTIDIDEGRVIVFSEGLPGFPEARRFVLLEHSSKSLFYWLQSLDYQDLAFVVMDPLLVNSEYYDTIPAKRLREIGINDPHNAAILTIVTIDRPNRKVTTNLLGPLVIHSETRRGKQVTLEGRGYTTKHDVVPCFSAG